jgi:hypothetical protein
MQLVFRNAMASMPHAGDRLMMDSRNRGGNKEAGEETGKRKLHALQLFGEMLGKK